MDYIRLTIKQEDNPGEVPAVTLFDQSVEITEVYRLLLVMLSDGHHVPLYFLELDPENSSLKLQYHWLVDIPVILEHEKSWATAFFSYTISSAGPGTLKATIDGVIETILIVAKQRPHLCAEEFKDAMDRHLAARI